MPGAHGPGTFRTQDKIIRLRSETDLVNEAATMRGRREDDEDSVPTAENRAVMEAVYTSTGGKLMQHLDRLTDAQKGIWRPINLQIAPTDKCNLECYFCSTWDRAGDEIPIDDLKKCLDDFVSVGPIKSSEVTGGGDPTMYKDLVPLIGHLRQHDVDVGMITNGLLLKARTQGKDGDKFTDALNQLTWLRVSLAFLDDESYYTGTKKQEQILIPRLPNTTIGVSYVWSEHSTRDKLLRIAEIKNEVGAAFARIVPNCQNPDEQKRYRNEMKRAVEDFPGIFFQTKDYGIHHACRVGYIKPFLNADGFLYHCSATPLYKGSFSEGKEWRIGHMADVKKLWPSNLPKMDTSNCYAGKCFYKNQNEFLHSLELEVPHRNFV